MEVRCPMILDHLLDLDLAVLRVLDQKYTTKASDED